MIQAIKSPKKEVAKHKARHGGTNLQDVCNNLLWKIVMNNGGKVNISCSELKQMTDKSKLSVKYDKATDSMIVEATQGGEKSNLILPGRLIT